MPVPTPVLQSKREPRRCSATDRGKCSFRAFGDDAGGRARSGDVDREEEISQSDAETVKKAMINETSTVAERRDNTDLPACEEKSEMAMNTVDQNANAVEEGARLCHGVEQRQEQLRRQNISPDAPLHDERVSCSAR